MSRSDPYAVLGIGPNVTDAELRAAYRSAVQRHHPDHNGGSPESARRFEEVQEAYAAIRAQRTSGAPGAAGGRPSSGAQGSSDAGASTTDSRLDARLAAMEAELAAARDARERVRRAARDAVRDVRDAARGAAREAAQGSPRRPSDEELGYIKTDDSLSSILDDTVGGLADRLAAARRRNAAGDLGSTVTDKVADAFEDIGARLRGERRD